MALVVPNSAEDMALKAWLNHTAQGENQLLRLYVNDITPSETDSTATFTAAAGGGYADIALTGSSWVVSGGASYAQQTFTFTGALTGNAIIYGYLVIRATTLDIMWAERAAASFQPAVNGDNVKITPAIGAD